MPKREQAIRAVWDEMVRAGWIDGYLEEEDAPPSEVEDAWSAVRSFVAAYEAVMRERDEGTVQVRIACVVAEDGKWRASGRSGQDGESIAMEDAIFELAPLEQENFLESWITAVVPLPKAAEVEGEVENAPQSA